MHRAIVVGCSAYEDPDIAPLRFAHRDAVRVAGVLRETCSVADQDVVLLHDEAADPQLRPTRTNLVRQLTRVGRAGSPDDILFFFFSGHGFQGEDNAQYLLPVDAVRGAIEDTALRIDSIVRYLDRSDTRHMIFFLDACRNVVQGGKAAAGAMPLVDVNSLCPPGFVSFCSCSPGQVSYEAETLGSGVFTAALCDALSDTGRCRTVYELDRYLAVNVPALARAHGKPLQQVHSRVEPLGVQKLEIVGARKRNEWLSTTPIGAERRKGPVAAIRPPGAVRDPLVAIDFGTSYSVVSWCGEDGDVILLPGPDGRPLIPSVVHFLPGLDYLVGEAAVQADIYRPETTIRHMKRRLGTTESYDVEGRSISPELAASLVIRSLRTNAEQALGSPVERCLATYPASYTLRRIEALTRAFELAGLQVVRTVGEPNVTALLAEHAPGTGEAVSTLVIDLGGGTFDVALVEAGEGVAEIVSTAGTDDVGGLDFDLLLIDFAERQLRQEHGWRGELTPAVREKIRREAERAKRELGRFERSTLLLQDLDHGPLGLVDISIELDRATFRRLTARLTTEIGRTVERAFERTLFGETIEQWRDHGNVLFAGQGTKIFTVREEIERLLPGVACRSEFQETAVAQGAGTQSGVLAGDRKNILLLNVAQFGLAVSFDTVDGGPKAAISPVPTGHRRHLPLIEPMTTIPTKRSESIKLGGKPGDRYRLRVVEHPESADLVFGTVEVCPVGSADIEVSFDIDADNAVGFTICDLAAGKRKSFAVGKLRPRFIADIAGHLTAHDRAPAA